MKIVLSKKFQTESAEGNINPNYIRRMDKKVSLT